MSLEKVMFNVPQRGQVEYPYKRTRWMSPKKDKLNVPQKGQVEYPPKRTSRLSLKKDMLDAQKKDKQSQIQNDKWDDFIEFVIHKLEVFTVKINILFPVHWDGAVPIYTNQCACNISSEITYNIYIWRQCFSTSSFAPHVEV